MRHRHTLTLAAALFAAACGPFHHGPSSDAYVVFKNQALDQVDVYAVPIAGDRMRVGTVAAGRTETLRLPPTAIGGDGTVNIIAQIFASNRAPRTGRIPLGTGQRVQVTLPPDENTLTVLPAP